jgi:flagellar biosynthesis/type III secretory pathway M-ring protein FliF/YscJ
MAAGLLGELPALPLHTAGKYVAAAYVVLFALVLIYVVIMAIRLGRIERELGELLSESETGEDPEQAAEEEELDVSRAGSTVT